MKLTLPPPARTKVGVTTKRTWPDGTEALPVSFGCAAIVVAAGSRITACDKGAERLLRRKLDPATRKKSLLLPPEMQQIIREAEAGQRPVANRRLTLPVSKKLKTTFHVLAVPIKSNLGRTEVVILLGDPSATWRAEQNLMRLDRLANLATLSASMAHEIKNALVSVKTFVDLLLEKNRDAELTEVVRREIHRIDTMVGQMVKHAGPGRPAVSAVRVHDVLDHSLRMVKPQIEGRLISLNRAFNAVPDSIQGDDYQLEQAFVNLLLNAIEAMGPSGSLTVATDLIPGALSHPLAASAARAHLRVAITDTGVGITPKNMERLFEPFFTTKQQGTGLGLTIARHIVQEHRGDIRVQSQENKGTTFNVLLPLHASAT